MRASLVRIGQAFLALTAGMVAIALLQVWELAPISDVAVVRCFVTYVLLSALLGVHAVVTHIRDDGPRSHDGDNLID
jgi:hypothetical protein